MSNINFDTREQLRRICDEIQKIPSGPSTTFAMVGITSSLPQDFAIRNEGTTRLKISRINITGSSSNGNEYVEILIAKDSNAISGGAAIPPVLISKGGASDIDPKFGPTMPTVAALTRIYVADDGVQNIDELLGVVLEPNETLYTRYDATSDINEYSVSLQVSRDE